MGFVVVQQLIADSTQRPFGDFMRDEVFAPLTMTHSTFEQPLDPVRSRDAASGHRRDGHEVPGGSMVHPLLTAAGLWTTPSDHAQVIIELQAVSAGRGGRLLAQDNAREMLTARIDDAGLGVFLTGPNGISRRFTHSGRNAGFDARLVGYKNGRDGAVVMINRNNTMASSTKCWRASHARVRMAGLRARRTPSNGGKRSGPDSPTQ